MLQVHLLPNTLVASQASQAHELLNGHIHARARKQMPEPALKPLAL